MNSFPKEPPPPVFWLLAALFVAVGGLAGAVFMHGYLKHSAGKQSGNQAAGAPVRHAEETPGEPPATDAKTPTDDSLATGHDDTGRPPEEATRLLFERASGDFVVHERQGDETRESRPGAKIAKERRVSVEQGHAFFSFGSTSFHAAAPAGFHINKDGELVISRGRVCVIAGERQVVLLSQVRVILSYGAAVFDSGAEKEIALVSGGLAMRDGERMREAVPPSRVSVGTPVMIEPLSAEAARKAEAEMLGPHRVLREWRCEHDSDTPSIGRRVTPGSWGSAGHVIREEGRPGIGTSLDKDLLTAEPNARLRLRVKTRAPRLRIELRVHTPAGARVVDLETAVSDHARWTVVDVALDELRMGYDRGLPGWLPGCIYRGLLLTPAGGMGGQALAVDDILIYVPG